MLVVRVYCTLSGNQIFLRQINNEMVPILRSSIAACECSKSKPAQLLATT